MPLKPADSMPVDTGRRLSAGLWVAAGVEIAVAVAVAALILHADHAMPAPDMHPSRSAEAIWHIGISIFVGFSAVTLAWWLATRARVSAMLAAAGLAGLATSETVRTMAVQSHLVGMAALEVLLVAVPLLLVAAFGTAVPTTGFTHSRVWTVGVIITVILNSVLLIVLHLPSVHGEGAYLGIVPLWLAAVVVVIGLSYWTAILITAGRVLPGLRRGALIVGQEVAAILGLAALLGPSPNMQHINPLGLSATLDQRLGGLLMLIACAAVTLPLAKRREQQQLRMECNVH
ncbi:MAG: hypothetical protein ACRDTK_01340 [Mycobacterium sp.]